MKKILTFIFLSLSLIVFSQTKNEKIRELLVKTKSADMGIQMMTSFFDQYKSIYPDIPNEFWEGVKKEVKAEELINLIIPIYDRNFTEADIDGLLDFYSSPIGAKFIEKTPVIFKESQEVGQIWGETIAKRVLSKLQDSSNYSSPPPPNK